MPLLQVPDRDVVDDGVPVDVVLCVRLGHLVPAGAEHDAELALVIACRGGVVADAHFVARPDDGRQRLGEDHRRVGDRLLRRGVEAAARELARMFVVVLADAHDVVSRPDRREQADARRPAMRGAVCSSAAARSRACRAECDEVDHRGGQAGIGRQRHDLVTVENADRRAVRA